MFVPLRSEPPDKSGGFSKMKVEKRVISNLNKCYAMSRLTFRGKPAFLVAA